MTKRQMVVTGGLAVIVVLAIGGFLLFGKSESKTVARGEQTVGDHIIPLGQRQQDTESSGGLSVVSASGGSQGVGQANLQGQQTGSGKSGSSNGGIDPTKFGEYDKYKDSPSALYADVQQGTGKELGANMRAAVFYKGWLTNGSLFDQSQASSDGKIQPFVFQMGVGQVIPGWEQSMAGMKVGGTRLLIIPPAVGYGSQGQGPIPPSAVLVFLVQLVDAQ